MKKKKFDVRWIVAVLMLLLAIYILVTMTPIVMGWLDAIPT